MLACSLSHPATGPPASEEDARRLRIGLHRGAGVGGGEGLSFRARNLIHPADIAHATPIREARWIAANLPGVRVMDAGEGQWLFNIFADNPQMGAGHEPSAPNWMQRVAVYTIYSGKTPVTGTGQYRFCGSKPSPAAPSWCLAPIATTTTIPSHIRINSTGCCRWSGEKQATQFTGFRCDQHHWRT